MVGFGGVRFAPPAEAGDVAKRVREVAPPHPVPGYILTPVKPAPSVDVSQNAGVTLRRQRMRIARARAGHSERVREISDETAQEQYVLGPGGNLRPRQAPQGLDSAARRTVPARLAKELDVVLRMPTQEGFGVDGAASR